MQVTPLSPHVGAEVTGIDLRQPMDDATLREVVDVITKYIAVVFRDQDLSVEEFLAFGRQLGTPMDQTQGLPGTDALVRQISNKVQKTDSGKAVTTVQGTKWHTDQTNLECPPKYTVLQAVSLPDAGGGTTVANMRAAYQALPEDLKKKLAGMRTLNVFSGSATKDPNPVMLEKQMALGSRNGVEHPLVRTHPVDGSKALYFHPKKTECIVGMSPEESQAFLDDLLKQALRPEFEYTHKWRMGDVFLWDNRCSLHHANADFDHTQHRLLYRLVVEGERPN
jgi:taurine dioxygenase